jgi:hypothetical protein
MGPSTQDARSGEAARGNHSGLRPRARGPRGCRTVRRVDPDRLQVASAV